MIFLKKNRWRSKKKGNIFTETAPPFFFGGAFFLALLSSAIYAANELASASLNWSDIVVSSRDWVNIQ